MIELCFAANTGTSSVASMVMLRWVVPAGWPYDSSRELVELFIRPAVRASGWLWSPGTTHHVEDHGAEVWLTVVTHIDDATDVRDDLTSFMKASPRIETTRGLLLSPRSERYRLALQHVTETALDLIDVGAPLPLTEQEAFTNPTEGALLLMPMLNRLSTSYRRSCSSYELTERFWLEFFQPAPTPDHSPAGHVLWNLAG